MRKACMKVLVILLTVSLSLLLNGCSQADGTSYTVSPHIITEPYWQEITTGNAPSPRGRAMSAYDPIHDTMVLFGGSKYDPPNWNEYYNDTWEFSNNDWRQIDTPISPSPRHGGGMCYCPAWDKFILFGGYCYDNGDIYYNDTWSYDVENGWKKLTTSHAPTGRNDFGLTFDEKLGKVILFGGGDMTVPGYHSFYSFNGNDWEKLEHGLLSPRRNTKLAFDRNRQVTVLFGGFFNVYEQFNDTWEYDGFQWTEQHPAHKPPKLMGFNLCYYAAQQKIVLFGGTTLYDPPNDDTWLYDGHDWEKLTFEEPSPSGRIVMTLSDCGDRVIMFGGRGEVSSIQYDDTWSYSIYEDTTTVPASGPVLILLLLLLFPFILVRLGFKIKVPFGNSDVTIVKNVLFSNAHSPSERSNL